jgi:hypothetical protein
MKGGVQINHTNNSGSVLLSFADPDADGFTEIIGCISLIVVPSTCVDGTANYLEVA